MRRLAGSRLHRRVKSQRECAASPEHRVFFALQPDDQASNQITRLAAELRQRHGLQGRITPAPRLHLSLNDVGTFRGPPTRAVMEKATSLAERVSVAAFAVNLNQVESWRADPHPLVLLVGEGVPGAERLHTGIHKALAAGTMAPRREPLFWPHVSLLWDHTMVPRTLVEPINWTVREFVLLDSIFGEGRHEVLGRWPLTGR